MVSPIFEFKRRGCACRIMDMGRHATLNRRVAVDLDVHIVLQRRTRRVHPYRRFALRLLRLTLRSRRLVDSGLRPL